MTLDEILFWLEQADRILEAYPTPTFMGVQR